MERRSVQTYARPRYPDKAMIKRDPALLRHTPALWLKKPLVGFLMTALMAAGAASCRPSAEGTQIPLFEHGWGRAWFGGMGNSTGHIMTDDEGLYIIRRTLEDAGYSPEIPGAARQVIRPMTYSDSYNTLKPTKGTVEFDALLTLESGAEVHIEFVSLGDYSSWHPMEYENYSTASSYELLSAAKILSEENTNTAVFYDPLEAGEIGRAELLRRQVLDFIEWLRASDLANS